MGRNEPVEELRNSRSRFGKNAARRKLRLIDRCSRSSAMSAKALRACHDTLMFVSAYPDSREVLNAAQAGLQRLRRVLRDDRQCRGGRMLRRLKESGIAGTEINHSFTIDMVERLFEAFPKSVELDWQEESLGSAFEEFLAALVSPMERDGLLENRLSTLEWLQKAKRAGESDVAWLVHRIRRLHTDPLLLDRAFDALELGIRWRLDEPGASRTCVRFPARRPYYQAGPLSRAVDLRAMAALPIPPVKALPRVAARTVLRACRATLSVRHRETDPTTYADEREVYLVRLDHGIDVAVFGMIPCRRPALESYFGYVVARNRVPVGYGGAWVFLDRADVGVNIFEEFRGGESGYIFAQVLRAIRGLFDVTLFTVDPYQVGAGNSDAIRSGALWFYHRLGFRSVVPKLAAIADAEWAKIEANRLYRTPAGTLRRLASARLAFSLHAPGEQGVAKSSLCHVPDLPCIGMAVTRWIGERFGSDLTAAQRWASRRAARLLRTKTPRQQQADKRRAFESFALLLGGFSELPSWTPAERRALRALVLAKGGPSERLYARKLHHHARLVAALRHLAAVGNALTE